MVGIRFTQKAATIAALSVALVGSPFITSTANAAEPTVEVATGGSDNWAAVGSAGGTATFVPAGEGSPLPAGAARLATGTGDPVANTSGKPYLYQNGLGDTLVTDITDLGYQTKVETIADPTSKLAPSMGLSIASSDPANGEGLDWQGTLVFEPINQSQTPVVGSWQSWNPMATDAMWWSTRDVVDANGNVVFARQSTHTLEEFKAAFEKNPKYTNLRLDPRGGGFQVYAGNSTYMAAWNNFSALVDEVTFGTAPKATTWDFEQGLGSCPVSVDGDLYTLLEDCKTFTSITAPNGATIDGNGHTLTAVEDANHANFQGSVIASAVGDAAAPAELNVKNLDIKTDGFQNGQNSGGSLNGIYMHRAGGSITNVSVAGISHGNGTQEGNGVSIRNRVAGDDIDVRRAAVTLSDVQITNYQKTGLLLDGNLRFTADDVTVGSGAGPTGLPNDLIAANSVQISRGASGSLTNSTVALNSHVQATGVLMYNARNVKFARNIVSGAQGETGVYVENDSNLIDTDFTMSCTLIERTGAPDAGDGLYVYDEEGQATATVTDSTVVGWTNPMTGVETPTKAGDCNPTASAVTASGGNGRSTISWDAATAPAYAPVTDYTVQVGSLAPQNVGPSVRTVNVTGLDSGVDYPVTLTAHNASGDDTKETTLNGTVVDLTTADGNIVHGTGTDLSGSVKTLGGVPVSGETVTLQGNPAGNGSGWANADTSTTSDTGQFTFAVEPTTNMAYRVVYAGAPHLNSTSTATSVAVATRVTFIASDRTVRRGDPVLYTGSVSPDHAGDEVLLQRQVATGWRTLQTGTLTENSSYVFRWTPTTRAEYTFRVVKPADVENARGTSREIRMVVR